MFNQLDRVNSATKICLVALLSLLLCTNAAQAEEKIFGNFKLPADGYAETLREEATAEKTESRGLEFTVKVIADHFVYKMALAFEEARKIGHSGDQLEKFLKTAYKKNKKLKGQALMLVKLESEALKSHYFFRTPVKKAIKIKGGASMSGKIAVTKPELKFYKWKIFAGPATKHWNMALFEGVEFEVAAKLKKSKAPVDLSFIGLAHYKEIQKKSVYEKGGINKEYRQIALGNANDLIMEKVSLKFYPGKWKSPEAPKDFTDLLNYLTNL